MLRNNCEADKQKEAIDTPADAHQNNHTIATNNTGTCLTSTQAHVDAVGALTVLADDIFISGGYDGDIKCWQLDTTTQSMTCLSTWRGHASPIEALIALNQQTVLSGGYDNQIMYWRVDTQGKGTCLATWVGHTGPVYALTFFNKSEVVSGSDDARLMYWQVNTSGQGSSTTSAFGHSSAVRAVAVLDSELRWVLSGSDDTTIKSWQFNQSGEKKLLATWQGHTNHVRTLLVLNHNSVFSGSTDHSVRHWQVDTQGQGICLAVWQAHVGSVYTLALLHDGSIISGGWDTVIKRWQKNMVSKDSVETWQQYTGRVLALTTLNNGYIISGSSNGVIYCWRGIDEPQLQQAAYQENWMAQYYLGLACVNKNENSATSRNMLMAVQWMQKAAKQGLYKAITQLYEWALCGEEHAFYALLLLADNNAVICYWLGQLYYHGFMRDMRAALEWMKLSADLGCLPGQTRLQQWHMHTLLTAKTQMPEQDSEWARLKEQEQRIAHTVLMRRRRGIKKPLNLSTTNELTSEDRDKDLLTCHVNTIQDALSAHQLGCLLGSQYTQLITNVKAVGATTQQSTSTLQLDIHSSAIAQLRLLICRYPIADNQAHQLIWCVLVSCLPIYQLVGDRDDDVVLTELDEAMACVHEAIITVGKSQWSMRHMALAQLYLIEKNYAEVKNTIIHPYKGANALDAYRGYISVAILGEGYYAICVDTAKQLLSLDTTRDTTDKLGTHTVVALDGVHYKLNSDLATPIRPGKEYAVGSLMQLFAKGSLAAAPITLLSVDVASIDNEKPLATKQMDGLVQGSLTITGINLKAFLECRGTLYIWQLRLSEQAVVDLIRDIQGGFAWALTVAMNIYPAVFNAVDLQSDSGRWALSEALRHAFEDICANVSIEQQLGDIQQLAKRNKKNRPNVFRALFENAIDNQVTLVEWQALLGVLHQYPALMENQTITDCLKQFKHIKHISTLFPKTPLQVAIAQLPELLTARYLDTHSMSALWLGLLLTLPCDAKFPNLILQIEYNDTQQVARSRLVTIDNDLSLTMPFSTQADGELQLELKNSLILLPELMQLPIDTNIRDDFLSVSVQGYYLTWLSLLAKRDNDYQQWLQQGTVSGSTLHTIDIPVKLPRQVWQFIKKQWQVLQVFLRHHERVTLGECLTHLYPLVDAAYRGLVDTVGDISDPLLTEAALYRFFEIGGCCPLTQLLPQGWPPQWEDQCADNTSESISSAHFIKELLTQLDWTTIPVHQQWPIVEGLSLLPELTLTDWCGNSPDEMRPRIQRWLFDAIEMGRPLVAQRLLNLGASVSITADRGETALHRLCQCYLHYLDNQSIHMMAEVLLSHHSGQPDAYDEDGLTPLLRWFNTILQLNGLTKIQHENALTLLDKLIAHGVNVEAKDARTHQTTLDNTLTANPPQWDWFELLVEKGAGLHANGLMIVERALARGLAQQPHLRDVIMQLAKRNISVAWALSQQVWQSVDEHTQPLHYLYGINTGRISVPDDIVDIVLFKDKTYFKPTIQPCDETYSELVEYGQRIVKSMVYADAAWHIKHWPEMPSMSAAVNLFNQRLFGWHTTPNELFVYFDKKNKPCPLLISQTIPGKTLQSVLTQSGIEKEQILSRLDRQYASEHIITAMLIQPGDGKPDNYQLMPITVHRHGRTVQRYQLVDIDNDHVFVQTEQVKSVLFCLENMRQPVHAYVRQRILALSADLFLKNWLKELIIYQKKVVNLFDSPTREYLFADSWYETLSRGEKRPPTVVTIAFQDKAIIGLWNRLLTMQTTLKDNPSISHLQLLKILSPPLGRHYGYAFDRFSRVCEVGERFHHATILDSSAKMAHYNGALATSIQAMYAMGLTPAQQKEVLIDTQGVNYGPAGAYHQLEIAISQKQQLDKYRNTLSNSKLTLEMLLSPTLKANIVNEFDFRDFTVDATKAPDIVRQRALLEAVTQSKVAFHNLTIKHCAALTDEVLMLLLQHSPELTHLTLIDCPYITDALGNQLAEYTPYLIVLTLKYLPQLTWLATKKISGILNQTTEYSLLSLQQLQQTTLSHNARLQGVRLSSPILIYAKLKQNVTLSELVVHAEHLKVFDISGSQTLSNDNINKVLQYCQQIDLLDISGCQRLSDAGLHQAFATYPTLPKINLTHCPLIKADLWHSIDYIRQHAPLYFPTWDITQWQMQSLLLSSYVTEAVSYVDTDDLEDEQSIALVLALLANNINLHTLLLTMYIKHLAPTMTYLLKLLQANQAIHTLCLLGVALNQADIAQLITTIVRCPNIRTLALTVDDTSFVLSHLKMHYQTKRQPTIIINGETITPSIQTKTLPPTIHDIGTADLYRQQAMIVNILTAAIQYDVPQVKQSAANWLAFLSVSEKLDKLPAIHRILEEALSHGADNTTVIHPHHNRFGMYSISSSASTSHRHNTNNNYNDSENLSGYYDTQSEYQF